MAKSSNRSRLVSSAPKVPVQPGDASQLQQGKVGCWAPQQPCSLVLAVPAPQDGLIWELLCGST